jgi:hypothetical protein
MNVQLLSIGVQQIDITKACSVFFVETYVNNVVFGIMIAHNLTSRPHTIDVHRLRVHEAVRKTEIAIRDALLSDDGTTEIRVIVGRGNHSAGKVPVLKLSLVAELTK